MTAQATAKHKSGFPFTSPNDRTGGNIGVEVDPFEGLSLPTPQKRMPVENVVSAFMRSIDEYVKRDPRGHEIYRELERAVSQKVGGNEALGLVASTWDEPARTEHDQPFDYSVMEAQARAEVTSGVNWSVVSQDRRSYDDVLGVTYDLEATPD